MTEFIYRSRPGTGRPLLLLHGTGGDEEQLLGLGQMLAPSAPLLSPRGRELENGSPRFFRRPDGVPAEKDLRERAAELAAWVDSTAANPPVAVGLSSGADIAAAMILVAPHALAGAILIRPVLPFASFGEPPDLSGVRVLILSGLADPAVPDGHPDALADLLRRGRARVDLAWQPAGHQLGAGDLQAARDWLSGHRW